MKEHDNEQWDDQYPLLEHFEEDIAKRLFVRIRGK